MLSRKYVLAQLIYPVGPHLQVTVVAFRTRPPACVLTGDLPILVSAIVDAGLRHLWWRLNTISAGRQLADVLVVEHPVAEVSEAPGFAIFSLCLPSEAQTETQALSERGSSTHHHVQQITHEGYTSL